MTLHIGVARADITPPVGIPMVGFAGRDEANAVHDPLTVSVLVLAEGERQAALVCVDLLSSSLKTAAALRQTVSTISGISADQIALAYAHNHYGPDVDRSDSDLVAAYRQNLAHVLGGAVLQARGALQPARLGIGRGQSDIGVNRREKQPDGSIVLGQNPEGPVDHQVGVARFDDDQGRPLATLVNYACHPVSQARQMQALSADFPGSMRQVVESLTGAPALFVQGACGDIDPVRMEPSYEPARSLGTRLGCEVVRVWETIETREASGLQVEARTLALPGYRYGSEENASQLVAELEQAVERISSQSDSASALVWAQRRLKRARRVLDSWTRGEELPPVEAELQAWRIGDLALATASGEIFNQIGRRIKEGSPFVETLFVGYLNGSIGYVPVREAYSEGGYEVTHACQVDPEAGDMVEGGCLDLLRSLEV